MSRKFRITSVALLCGLLVLLSALYLFRETLLRVGLNLYLPQDQLSLASLEGVHIDSSGVTVAALDLRLPGSAQRLSVTGFTLSWRRPAFFSLPAVETLVISAVRLQPDATLAPPVRAPTPAPADSGVSAAPTISGILQLLGNFPLRSVQLTELLLPRWPQPLTLQLESKPGTLQVMVGSGDLQLEASFAQPDATASAQLALVLRSGEQTPGALQVTLEPLTAAWRLAGQGVLALAPDSLPAALQSAQPFSALALDWQLGGELADDLYHSAPAVFTLALAAGATARLPAGLAPGFGELTLALRDGAQITGLTGSVPTFSAGSLPLDLAGSWQDQPLTAHLVLAVPACPFATLSACTLGFVGTAALAAYVIAAESPEAAPTTLTGLALDGAGTVGMDPGMLRARLEPGFTLTLADLASGAVHAAGLAVSNAGALTLGSNPDAPYFFVDGTLLTGTLEALDIGEYHLDSAFELRDLSLSYGADLAASGLLQTSGLGIRGPQAWLPAADVAVSVVLAADQLDFSTPLLLRGAAADSGLRLEGHHVLASRSGSAHLTLPPLSFAGEAAALSSYVGDWPHDFDLVGGTIAAEMALQWQPASGADQATAYTGSLAATLTEVAGYYGDNFFRGLNTAIEGTLDSTAVLPLNTPPLALSIADVDVGLPVTNVTLRYQFDRATQTLTIASLHGELLDGTVSATEQRYVFGSARNTLTVDFAGFRLERLLELTGYEGVQASGAVSGAVPILFTEQGIEVAAGRLFGMQPGGNIRYLGTVGNGQGNAGLDIMNQALGNYQFESLESSIDYTPDGELLLGMKLQGYNPDMNNGQRINLNLNLSDNIPALLKSLRAGRAIEDFLQQQYE